MAYTSVIEDTKQEGYDFYEAQGTEKLGIDIAYIGKLEENEAIDESTYIPVYTSVNAEGTSVKNEGEDGEDIYPMDELGAVNTGKGIKWIVETDSFNYNSKNLVHKAISKIVYNDKLGKNVPVIVEDSATEIVMKGRADITAEMEAVGGDKRKLTPVFTFIGAPDVSKME